MTCIVGIANNGKVTMGGDAACIAGYKRTISKTPKVFINGSFLMGYTTCFRMGQILQYGFVPPLHLGIVSIDVYMRTVWIDEVRKSLGEGGWKTTLNGKEEGGTFLVGYRGRLFCIDGNFEVLEPNTPYEACGCGQDIANGAMHALSTDDTKDDITKVRMALEAASQHSINVCPPFTIITL